MIEQVNDAAVRMLKYASKSEIEGKARVVDFSPEVQPDGTPTMKVIEKMTEQMLKGEGAVQEVWHIDREGALFPVLVKAKVRGAGGGCGRHLEVPDMRLRQVRPDSETPRTVHSAWLIDREGGVALSAGEGQGEGSGGRDWSSAELFVRA